MAEKINEAKYAKGRQAFDSGMTVRDLIEHHVMPEDIPQDASMSFVLGFADGLLAKLRGDAGGSG